MTEKNLKTVISLMGLFGDFPTWTKDKRSILKLVYNYLESGTHEYFTSHCSLHGSYVGDYYIERANHQRRGTLKKYRGKKVIVMFVGHGSMNVRHYIVATVD